VKTLLLALLGMSGMWLGAPGAEEPFPPGAVVEKLSCRADPTQTYALYLPSAYDPARRWPVLILMDPRGRALVPVELFRAAAEKRGWILMSSYDTASDGPWEPNQKAVSAMLPEAQTRHRGDSKRLYLSGFSGTARVGWEFGLQLQGRLAGLIGFGGGLPFASSRLHSAPFPFYGAAGLFDFNHEEMRSLDEQLEAMHAAHRFESFDGPHSWGPESLCARAVDWMEIQAMKSGLKPRDTALVEEIFSADSNRAASLESAGKLYEAFLAWRTLERDFADLKDVAQPKARRMTLEASKPVRKAQATVRSLAAGQTAYEVRLGDFLANFHTAAEPPGVARSLAYLQIALLKRRATSAANPLDAQAAQRLLEMTFVHLAFYEPRQFLDQSNPARALAMLQVAAAIRPEDPGVLYAQARAHAVAGSKERAIESLRRAVAAGMDNVARIETDEALASLRAEPGYLEILERLRAAAPPGK